MSASDNVPVCVSDLSNRSARFVSVVSDEIDSGEYPEEALLAEDKTLNPFLEDIKKN